MRILDRMKKHRIVALVLFATLSATSCIGPNEAFNSLHSWNGEVTDQKWAQAGIHLAFWLVPAYPLCLLGDILVFNSIEFWGGQNPIKD